MSDVIPSPVADSSESTKSPQSSSSQPKQRRRPLRRRSKSGAGPSRLISQSNATLLSLRESLLAEEQEEQEKQKEASPRKKTSKGSKARSVKANTDEATSQSVPKADKKKRKEPLPKITAKTEQQSTSKITNKKDKKPAEIISAPSAEDAKPQASGPRITRCVGKKKRATRAEPPRMSARGKMITAIQEGRLPERERREALRSVRYSVFRKVGSPERSPASRSIKDAMLRPQRKAPYSQRRARIEVPYEVGQPRAGNAPPIQREPPGPVSSALEPKFLRGGMTAHEIETVKADGLNLIPIDAGPLEVPKLAYGLERVLFNPGVYQLQDPRTRVFNFDPYLQTIMPASEFDFNALKQYVTSSKDQVLLDKTTAEKKKYTGSTSSMTSALGHFHFLLSQWRLINIGNLSKMFPAQHHTFTGMQRAPVSIFLRWKDGTYAIDADKQFDGATILSMLGKSMEKLLTLPMEDFEKYRKGKSDQISEEERNEPEQFHYTTMGDFLLRSQLDAYDSRLPGTGMFDLKTRSVVSIRMDADDYEQGSGYQIRTRHGEWESFEREYYDMIRSAFLKYSLQVRMGRMDGIFVAYHNTERIFGFQYISLEEMDYAIHGTDDKRLGDAEFKLSLDLLNRVLDRATAKYPEKSLRIHFETRDAVTPFMYIFAEPVEEKKIEQIQATNASKIEEFERQVLGIETEELTEDQKKAQWDELRAHVEQTMQQDEHEPDRLVEDVEDDIDALTEDELHEIQAIVTSNSLDEDNEGLVDEDLNETDEDMNTPANDDIVETDGVVGKDGTELAPSNELEHENEEANAAELASDIESNQAEEAEVQLADDVTEETSSAKATGASETKDQLSGGKSVDEEDFVDEHASQDVNSNGPQTMSKGSRNKATEIMAMTLTIRNKINGKYVAQPDERNYPPGAKWAVEYALAEIKDTSRAKALYRACKLRRQRIFEKIPDLASENFQNPFFQRIRDLSQEGRTWREEQKEIEAKLPVKTLDSEYKSPNKKIKKDIAS